MKSSEQNIYNKTNPHTICISWRARMKSGTWLCVYVQLCLQ